MTSLTPWTGRRAFDPFSWDVWDPLDIGSTFGGTLWDYPTRRRTERDDTTAVAHTYVDWAETANSHVFRADVPGMRREEVKVQVEDGNILQISGEKTREEETDTDTWHRVERRRGHFRRRFRLPENADMENIQCSLDQGVLTVNVPKKSGTEREAGRNVRAIDIM